MCCRRELGCLLFVCKLEAGSLFLEPNSVLSFPIHFQETCIHSSSFLCPVSGAIRMVLIKNNFKAGPPRIVLISETFTLSLLTFQLPPSTCISCSMLTAFKLCFKISTHHMWEHLEAHERLAPLPSVPTPHWDSSNCWQS